MGVGSMSIPRQWSVLIKALSKGSHDVVFPSAGEHEAPPRRDDARAARVRDMPVVPRHRRDHDV